MTTIKSPNTAKEERNHPFGMIPLRIPITTRGTDRMGIRTGFKIVKNELICPKLLDIPKESRTFALLESATLPVEQRTRAELFLYTYGNICETVPKYCRPNGNIEKQGDLI